MTWLWATLAKAHHCQGRILLGKPRGNSLGNRPRPFHSYPFHDSPLIVVLHFFIIYRQAYQTLDSRHHRQLGIINNDTSTQSTEFRAIRSNTFLSLRRRKPTITFPHFPFTLIQRLTPLGLESHRITYDGLSIVAHCLSAPGQYLKRPPPILSLISLYPPSAPA